MASSYPAELIEYYKSDRPKSKALSHRHLVVRTMLKPVDVYAYLRARFGQPNGIQNFFRRDDSDNWIHWDFNLKIRGEDIFLAGTARDVRISVSETLTDQQWKELILAIKADFGRVGREKSTIMRSFEKYLVFQNKYVTLADLCAEMHESIVDSPPMITALPEIKSKGSIRQYKKVLKENGERAVKLYGDCLKLRLLTPIMAEAFLNMVIITFCKDAIRGDAAVYEGFIRAVIPRRLELLSEYCDEFEHTVDLTSEAYSDFMRVMNKRNFAIHGNTDPIREQIETVYFEGKRPLFTQNGDHVLKFFEHLERMNTPAEGVQDYEAVHAFQHEITALLSPRHRVFFDAVIGDPYPGYEVKVRRVNKILPNHIVTALFRGTMTNCKWTGRRELDQVMCPLPVSYPDRRRSEMGPKAAAREWPTTCP